MGIRCLVLEKRTHGVVDGGETAGCTHDTRDTHEKRRRRVCSSTPWNAEVWLSIRLGGRPK